MRGCLRRAACPPRWRHCYGARRVCCGLPSCAAGWRSCTAAAPHLPPSDGGSPEARVLPDGVVALKKWRTLGRISHGVPMGSQPRVQAGGRLQRARRSALPQERLPWLGHCALMPCMATQCLALTPPPAENSVVMPDNRTVYSTDDHPNGGECRSRCAYWSHKLLPELEPRWQQPLPAPTPAALGRRQYGHARRPARLGAHVILSALCHAPPLLSVAQVCGGQGRRPGEGHAVRRQAAQPAPRRWRSRQVGRHVAGPGQGWVAARRMGGGSGMPWLEQARSCMSAAVPLWGSGSGSLQAGCTAVRLPQPPGLMRLAHHACGSHTTHKAMIPIHNPRRQPPTRRWRT